MSGIDLLGYAATALTGHRLRALLSMTGVTIGVAAVILLTALGEGARQYVIGQFATLGANLLIVIPGKTETSGALPGVGAVPNDLTLADAQALRRGLSSIRSLSPISMGTENVSRGERRRQVPVMGGTWELLEVRDLVMARGEFLPAGEWDRGAPVAVIGDKVACELFPGENPVGGVVRIGDWRMRVIGVLSKQGVSVGMNLDEFVIVPVATGMKMFNRTTLFRILVKVTSHADLDGSKQRILAILRQRHGEEDVTLLTQDAVLSTFSAILTALTLALGAIAGISLTVAGIGIMNVMLVSVTERTSEVGLLKALGATRGQVLAAFLVEAILLTTAGGITGLALGTAAVQILVAIYPSLPAAAPAWAVAAALAVSLGVGAVFGVLPARRATRLDPVSALGRR